MRNVKTASDLNGLQWGDSFRYDGDTYTFLRILRTLPDRAIVNTSHHSTDNTLQINVFVRLSRPWPCNPNLIDCNQANRRTRAQG